MEQEKSISLDTLNQGAAVERFNIALQEALNNIQDPNTDAKKARVVTLKATIKPDADREIGSINVDVSAKLAPIAPFDVRVFLGRDKDGKGYATEYQSNQTLIPGTDNKEVDNVYKLNKKEAVQQ